MNASVFDYFILTIFSSILWIVSLSLLIKMVLEFRGMNNIPTIYKYSSLFVFISATEIILGAWFDYFTIPFLYSTNIAFDRRLFCDIIILHQIIIIFLFESSVLNYFAVRIDTIFSDNSAYKLSKWITLTYKILIYISAIIVIVITEFYTKAIEYNIYTETVDINDSKWVYCSVIDGVDTRILDLISLFYTLFLVVMNIIIWLLFVNRFYKIVIDQIKNIQREEIEFSKSNEKKIRRYTYDGHEMKLIAVMKKQTLLVTIATSTTIILWILQSSLPHAFICWMTDFLVTEICVFLSFAVNKKYYNFIGCTKCENKCCSCIDGRIQQNIIEMKVASSSELTV